MERQFLDDPEADDMGFDGIEMTGDDGLQVCLTADEVEALRLLLRDDDQMPYRPH